MRLDDARAEFRSRSPLEAVDFGAHLMRAHALPTARAVAALSLPPILAAMVLLFSVDEVGWAIFVVFWLRPLDARIALLVASRGLFGDVPSVRETARLLVTEGRTRLLWDLSLGRLSFMRAATLPVALLEGTPRGRRDKRVALVTRGQGGAMAAAALACLAFELVLAGSLTHLVEQAGELRHLLRPPSPDPSELFAGAGESWAVRARTFAFFYALVAPLGEALHTLAGFSLYLNRRTEAEGWDIELSFRRLAARVAASAALLVGLGLSSAALADDAVVDYERARREVDAALARPEFGEEIVEERYRLRFEPSGEGGPAEAPDLSFMARFIEVFAWLVVGLFTVGAALVLARALRFLSRPMAPRRASTSGRALVEHARDARFELEGALDRARRLAGEGRALEALALLYGGALEALSLRHAVDVPADATEGECLRVVRRRAPAGEAERFATVTRAWQLAAYRARLPSEAELGQLLEQAAPLFGEAS